MCSRVYAGPNPEKAPNTPRTLQGRPCNAPSLYIAGKKPETSNGASGFFCAAPEGKNVSWARPGRAQQPAGLRSTTRGRCGRSLLESLRLLQIGLGGLRVFQFSFCGGAIFPGLDEVRVEFNSFGEALY